MLTTDLLRARVQKDRVVPGLIDPTRKDLLEPAAELVDVVTRAADEGWTRGELDEALDVVVGDHRSAKVLKGLQKLLLDRCESEVRTPVPPAELRRTVFLRARARGPLALERSALHLVTADDVLAEVGAELGLTAEEVRRALYADLAEAQVIARFRPVAPDALLHRYNVALVQGLLLRAVEVRLELHRPTVPRLRQLLRFVKFHQLVHRAERDDDVLRVTVDGPLSLFRQSTRYGFQLAQFFPAVLLQPPPWRLEADVLWGPHKARKLLEVTPAMGLRSHLPDTGAWASRERQWFAERWEATADHRGFVLTDEVEPIELAGRGVVLPDFTFVRDGARAHLEIVGFWRKAWLERHLDALRRHGPGNLVLAVSRKLAGDEKADLDDLPGEVIRFAEVVPVNAVLDALERVAR